MIFRTLKKLKGKLNILSAASILALSLVLTGCGTDLSDVRLVFTTGYYKNEVFTIEDKSCNLSEALVYLVNTQEGYEESFGRPRSRIYC